MSTTHVGWIWRTELALVFLLASVVLRVPAQAQTFKVLHKFHYSDGFEPMGQLVVDKAGNLYGTTNGGGMATCPYYSDGCGTVFKLNKSGKQVWVHSFNRTNGAFPDVGLLRDTAGNFYGTTGAGGDTNCFSPYGCGNVFKLDKAGRETQVHKFTGNPDGDFPEALLIEDSARNLYGTTLWGGTDYGLVFKMDQTGKETVLYSFTGGTDGGNPYVGVIRDLSGNLYGTTGYGGDTGCDSGQGCGTVYELDPTGAETVLYRFIWSSDGAFPSSGLIQDSVGNLYGTTGLGGNMQIYECDGYWGCGVVYELSPNANGGWTETVLHAFSLTDGFEPGGGLVRDAAGNLYGTTYFGGASQCNGFNDGCGVVFKLNSAGNLTVLHTFTGGADGAYPDGGLVVDASGNIYGTTENGGDLNCEPKYHGCGVVFKITP